MFGVAGDMVLYLAKVGGILLNLKREMVRERTGCPGGSGGFSVSFLYSGLFRGRGGERVWWIS